MSLIFKKIKTIITKGTEKRIDTLQLHAQSNKNQNECLVYKFIFIFICILIGIITLIQVLINVHHIICMYLLHMFGYMHLLHIFFIYIYNEMTDILDKFVNTTSSFPEQCANAWLAYTLVWFFLLPLPINFRLHLLVRISQ